MTTNLKEALSSLNAYLTDFEQSGFSSERANQILELCREDKDSYFFQTLDTFGCGDFEAAALLLSLLLSVSPQAAASAARLCGAPSGAFTPALVSGLFFGTRDILPFASSLSFFSPLSRLLQGVAPRAGALLRLREFMSEYFTSGVMFDETFLPGPIPPEKLVPIFTQQQAIREINAFLKKYDNELPFVLQIAGEDGTGRSTCVMQALSDVSFLHLAEMPSRERLVELASKLLLTDRVPVVDVRDGEEWILSFAAALAGEVGLVILLTEHPLPLPGQVDTAAVSLSLPTLAEQIALWQENSREYAFAEPVDFGMLAGEFELSPGAVKKALRVSYALAEGDTLTETDVRSGCYRSFASDMGDKATRLPSVYTWEDIVLPEQSRLLLMDACEQVRLRHRVLNDWDFGKKLPYGRGVSMIFTGPPGTGKTMGAQVLARELGMVLYRISLANVVSKYIGETEKNLNEIFNKAKLCQAILFFDEADVLFSKRTEVKEANDKYSNMESAFLLQKTEEYNGVVILATNLVQNFDEAFKRRMKFLIDFPFPDVSHRRLLWQKAFPESVPLCDVDMEFLSEHFELSGSNIRNISLHSAYLAAAENAPGIGMKHIMEGIRNEYAKSGKAFTRAEAGEYYFESRR